MALFPTFETAVYTVTELTAILKQLVSGRFRNVRVEGEVSNAKLYPSGHLYFTLKDDAAMMKAVAFNYRGKFSGQALIRTATLLSAKERSMSTRSGENISSSSAT